MEVDTTKVVNQKLENEKNVLIEELNQLEREVADYNLCKVCWDVPINTILIPCAHLCLCKGCSDVITAANKECPICRKPFEEAKEIQAMN